MTAYEAVRINLISRPCRWLVTGAAGFIGSNLVETLLRLGQEVVGLDNFATGFRHNIDEVRAGFDDLTWQRFRFIEGDIRNLDECVSACAGADYVLHQAALGSVPRSIADPKATHEANVDGFLNMLIAARDARVKRFVFASSSSVYGDHPELPKAEDRLGRPLSPYAATKRMNELYATAFAATYQMQSVGLRYFNVFGPRQDPHGAYAAVIPRWIAALIAGQPIYVFGDGHTSRDFCYVDNAVQANLLAAVTSSAAAVNSEFNVAVGERTTLQELFTLLSSFLATRFPLVAAQTPVFRDFRPGDVRHSHADISKARMELGYEPIYRIRDGIERALDWYVSHLRKE